MPVRFEGEGIQTEGDVTELLKRIRSDPRTENPRVLYVNQMRMMEGRNAGYPIWMYHDALTAQQVFNEKEEAALAQSGFYRQYKHKSFPTFFFRRNMHPKFQKSAEERARLQQLTEEARRLEMNTVNEGDYIESRVVNNEAEAKKLLAEKENKGAGTGRWYAKLTEVPPFDAAPEEDPAVTIARLQGENDALRAKKQPAA